MFLAAFEVNGCLNRGGGLDLWRLPLVENGGVEMDRFLIWHSSSVSVHGSMGSSTVVELASMAVDVTLGRGGLLTARLIRPVSVITTALRPGLKIRSGFAGSYSAWYLRRKC